MAHLMFGCAAEGCRLYSLLFLGCGAGILSCITGGAALYGPKYHLRGY